MTKTIKDKWAIGLNNTALVVVDVQRVFVEKGAPLASVRAEELVPRINELMAICRKLKIPVILTKMCCRADLSDAGLPQDLQPDKKFIRELYSAEGNKGTDFYPGLDVKTDDYIVNKIRYSAFIPGLSSLEPLLRGLNRDRFIICGFATDICVGTTTADAMMLGFRVFVVGDLTATVSEKRQKVALEVLDGEFAKVMTFDEVMRELEQLAKELYSKRGAKRS